jgi:ketosteroid isomerase-like protein
VLFQSPDHLKGAFDLMTRSVLALFATAVVLILAGCKPAVDTNRNAGPATASPAKAAFDPAAIEAEVIKLEREWADANKSHNAEAVRRLVADDAVIVYPDGTVATKADEVSTIESGAITADAFEMVDPKVTVVNADSAFVTGRSVIRNGKYTDAKTKKSIDISGEYRFLDVYSRRDGKWQAVASQATKIAK